MGNFRGDPPSGFAFRAVASVAARRTSAANRPFSQAVFVREGVTKRMKHLLLKANGEPWPASNFPVFFRDRESMRSMIEERGPHLASLQNVRPANPIKVTWTWWRMSQSEFRYREIGEIDLGNFDE